VSLFPVTAPTLSVPTIIPAAAFLVEVEHSLGGQIPLQESLAPPAFLSREGIDEGREDSRVVFTPRQVTPLRPLHSLPVMASAFDSGERVDFVERLYREAGTADDAAILMASSVSPLVLTPVRDTNSTAPNLEVVEPSETVSNSGMTILLQGLAAGAALLLGGCGWLLHRRKLKPALQRAAASGGPSRTKGAQ
jgi:hypothetical protein